MKLNFKMVAMSVLAVSLAVSLSACSDKKDQSKAVNPGVPVTVTLVQPKEIIIKYKSIGQTKSPVNPVMKSQVSGHVYQILVTEGEAVKRGQSVIMIDKEKELVALNRADASFIEAKATYEQKKFELERKAILVKQGIISKLEFNAVQAAVKVAKAKLEGANNELYNAQFNLAKTDVISPITGYIQQILISVGDVVRPGTPLAKLINHSTLRMTLPFAQQKAHLIQRGQQIELHSPIKEEAPIKTVVTSVIPAVNPVNRSFHIVVDFENVHNWVAGSSVRGEVTVGQPFQSLVVPESSIVLRPNGLTVYIVKDGKSYAKPVVVGYQTGDEVAIYKGLQQGDSVVVDGAEYLGNGTPVIIKKQGPAQ